MPRLGLEQIERGVVVAELADDEYLVTGLMHCQMGRRAPHPVQTNSV